MIKKTFLLGIFLLSILGFSQVAVTNIYTDFNNFWKSGTSAINPVNPNNSHNLLGFTWNGITYSTGVDNSVLTSNGISFQPNIFKAFPTSYTQSLISPSYIGVGKNFGGSGNVMPVPVENDLAKYLTDGQNGLDLGTGVFNFPSSGNIAYDITSINPLSIGDGTPDVLITQIGDISSVLDKYYFVDSMGNLVGNIYSVDFGTVPAVGNADWKFYNTNSSPPTYNAGVSNNPTRKLRLLAFDWSELGLNVSNISQVRKLVQIFSGQSDAAFIAFNTSSIVLKTTVSGTVFNDNNAGTPNGNRYVGAKVLLRDALGNTVNTLTTDSSGNYSFPNISGGTYTVELTTPAGFFVVGNAQGNTNNVLPITVGSNPVTGNNFGINQPPKAFDDNVFGQFNTPVSFNISTNDVDPNNGAVVPNTINLILPPGATNYVLSLDGLIKSFTMPGQGSYSVNSAGVFTFTPDSGFTGTPTSVKYTIRDTANLLSNEGIIFIKVEDFCYRPSATTGTTLDTKHGITSLGRAGSQNADNWPMVRKGAWTALESKTKGFVVNRIPTTAKVNAIANPIEGMMVYDEEANCLKIYTTTDNSATFSWKCLNKQTCPTN